ncbi:MAG: acetyl-CoA carboxylase, carboxyltransferase subunit beta [Candidatus Marinimicrobia bacterium]|jgi:acetyl-CoA carboxylase carboxyl transferase subunit beta|nr:acetyl-CoA carboxylase, carboxyltransferase subunit beta [Candidatus Neomarinimicrobiota bacterium]MCK9484701.1 acetyl-CoA carboxylase, carboxyltransferase subunit beta [Candidatus Neomarinimicrobiota bacterium]MCK9560888.1 acetyl-CoA carboxylase, carboxyltransferase subunit beta [Candidatus Neomarinimicrobiota bacterium]MDD5231627.1 acetyl-CoA carboxylase, carboxyltransferase subunit beta [Candidatus Neomarinimicrobiota bacterium]
MADWFQRTKKGLLGAEKKVIPDGLWVKCPGCSEYLYKRELDKNYWVCTHCRYHFRIACDSYIHMLVGKEYEEFGQELQSNDPLKFKDSKKYADRLKLAMSQTGSNEAVKTVSGRIDDVPAVLCVMDFNFVGGSMGSVVGEKIARATDKAREMKVPLIIISQSGGARMQEGIYSLMQMAKTSAKLARFHEEGGLFISILTDPTAGGTTASFAMLGDLIISEPGAFIGFAGPRVIKQTIGHELPEGFQHAELLLEKGFIDIISPRSELKQLISKLLHFFYEKQ